MRKRIFILMIIGVLLLINTLNFSTVSASPYDIIRVRISVSGKSIDITVDGEYIIKEAPSIPIPRGSYKVTVSESSIGIKGSNLDTVIGSTLTLERCKY